LFHSSAVQQRKEGDTGTDRHTVSIPRSHAAFADAHAGMLPEDEAISLLERE